MIEGFPENDKEWLELGAKFERPMKGVVIVNDFEFPDPEDLGQYLVSHLVFDGVKKKLSGWTMLAISQDAPYDITHLLVEFEEVDRQDYISSKSYHIWFNALGVSDLESLGESVLEYIDDQGYCVVRGS